MPGTKIDDPKDTKDKVAKLLQQVKAGVSAPQEADDEAVRLGFGQLSRDMPMDEYHPISQSRWTPTMVLAWITWRSYSEVREWDARYLLQCRYWAPVSLGKKPSASTSKKGYGLCRRKPPTVKRFEDHGSRRFGSWLSCSDNRPLVLQAIEVENARPILWAALLSGKLHAEAIKPSGGARGIITAHEWQDLEIQQVGSGPEFLAYRHEPNKRVYKDVTWPHTEVLKCWSPHKFSDFPDQAGLQWGPMIDDADKWNELYDWLDDAEILNASAQVKLASKCRRKGTKKDLEELKKVQQSRLQEGQPLLRFKDMQGWAQGKGIGREWVRAVRRELPKHLKLERGQNS